MSDDGRNRIFASPRARRLAREKGVDLLEVAGSGPGGRIVARDIAEVPAPETAAEAGLARIADAISSGLSVRPEEAPRGGDGAILALYEPGSYEIAPHDGMRRVIAERLTFAAQTIPHFYLTADCRADELIEARARLNAAARGPAPYRLSINDFLVKALALALREVPAANATWTSQGMLRHRHSDVGVAVAVEGGLYTPVIREAELKSLSEISNEVKELAERAKRRRLLPREYQGGTTSISNLGMYGVKSFGAVINPPHATILAVGSVEQRAVVANGEIRAASVLSCTLSCDHRVVDGAVGAELLAAFKAYVEDPVRMLA